MLVTCQETQQGSIILDNRKTRFALKGFAYLYKYYFNPKGLSKNLLNISNYEFKVILNHECENNMKNAFSYQFIKFSWLLRHLIRAYVSKENNLYLFAKSNTKLLNSIFLILLFKIIMSLIYPILRIRMYFSSNGKNNDQTKI